MMTKEDDCLDAPFVLRLLLRSSKRWWCDRRRRLVDCRTDDETLSRLTFCLIPMYALP